MNDNPLEKVIEKKVCDYAKTKQMLVYKFTSPGYASVPDRLFFTNDGQVFLIEFKRKGKKPTVKQSREIARLISNQVPVFIVDEIEQGKRLIDIIHSSGDVMVMCNKEWSNE